MDEMFKFLEAHPVVECISAYHFDGYPVIRMIFTSGDRIYRWIQPLRDGVC